MHIQAHGISDLGKVRERNEDSLFIDEEHAVYAVADGLGGLPGGEEASGRIVDLLDTTFNGVDAEEERPDLGELVLEINRIVTHEGLEAHPFTGSGSTLTIGQIIRDQLLIAHVGDSAMYLLREGEFSQLTCDHTMEQEFIERMGEEARASMPNEYSHTLTRCVGQSQEVIVDETRITVHAGDRILLCTDGLNKVLTDLQMQCLLETSDCPKEITHALVDSANANKGPDNITAIVLLIS
ncbi:MAG: PP2C family protein-serine/threonine phosphatase [Opitutaceae bacterium]